MPAARSTRELTGLVVRSEAAADYGTRRRATIRLYLDNEDLEAELTFTQRKDHDWAARDAFRVGGLWRITAEPTERTP